MTIVEERVREEFVNVDVRDLTAAYIETGFAFICADGKLLGIERER